MSKASSRDGPPSRRATKTRLRVTAHARSTRSSRDDGRRGREVAVERQPEELPVRRIGQAAEPQRIGSEGPAHDLVLEREQAPPAAVRVAQPDLGVAAVAVRDSGEHAPPVLRGHHRHLCDPREVAAHVIRIRLDRCAELVTPDLLVEVQVGRVPLALARIARVEQGARSLQPRDAAAGRPVLDPRDPLADLLRGPGVEHVERAVLAAAHRERDGDEGAVERGDGPVDRGGPGRIQGVRIDDDLLGRQVVQVADGDEEHLLERRLELEGEQATVAPADRPVADGRPEEIGDALAQDRVRGQAHRDGRAPRGSGRRSTPGPRGRCGPRAIGSHRPPRRRDRCRRRGGAGSAAAGDDRS